MIDRKYVSFIIKNLDFYANPGEIIYAKTLTQRFIFVNLSMNFSDSDSYCQDHYGTHLATFYVKSDIEQAKAICWIGLNDIKNQDEWVYTSGVIYDSSISDWYPLVGEPNNHLGIEDCVEISWHHSME